MCRSYLINFAQAPCTEECSSHLTPRVRPCKQQGTPSCVRSVRILQVMYCCAFHFQSLAYPQITDFTKKVLRHRSKDYGNKYQALHETVQPHIRQFAYCSFLTYQTEYFEAARTEIYMRLHRNALPEGVDAPPRKHAQILEELEHGLAHALKIFYDDELLEPCVAEDEQPDGAALLLGYPAIGNEHFDMQMRDSREGRVAYYTFADIFDEMDSELESEGEEESVPVDPVLGGEVPVDPALVGGAVPATPVLRAAVPVSPVLGVPASPVLGAAVLASPVLSPIVPAGDIEIPLSAVLGGPGPGEAGPSNWHVRSDSSEVDQGRPGSPTLGRSSVFDFGWEEDEEEQGGG